MELNNYLKELTVSNAHMLETRILFCYLMLLGIEPQESCIYQRKIWLET